MAQPRVKRLLSTDHFSVDGTLVEAWASMKSFRPKDGSGEPPASGGGRNREADFHGQTRSNETHASTTDPQARLYRKGPGKEAEDFVNELRSMNATPLTWRRMPMAARRRSTAVRRGTRATL
jgi:hypothetical protein